MENLTIPNPIDNLTENLSKKDKEQISTSLGTAAVVICSIAIIAIPLIFVPFLADPIELPKQYLVFFLGVVGLLLWTIRKVFQGKFTWTRTTFDIPIVLLAIFSIVSSVLTPNLYSSLSSETLVIVGGACLFFLFAASPEKESTIEKFALFFSIPAAALGGLMVLQAVYGVINRGAGSANPALFFLNPGFNVAGSALAAGLFLVSVLPLTIAVLKSKEFKQKYLAIPLVILIGTGILGSAAILFQNRPILLDPTTGWKIATGVIGESPKNALLGIGSGNIVDAFSIYKPVEFNRSDFWNLRFSTSSNLYLSILTSLGIIGLALLIFFIVKFVRVAKSRLSLENSTSIEKGLIATISLILVLGIVFPAPLLSLFLLFTASGTLMAFYRIKGVTLYAKSEEMSNKKGIGFGITAILLVLLVGGGYYLGRFAIADFYFGKSLQAAAANNGKDTYDFQIKALELNPWNSNYRISYSQTNLALANSLAGQPNLTDEQKQTIVTLVQQAIREGRIAAALAPQRAGAWENLSLIYKNLINFAQGADQWAVASQSQASQLDPNNPRLLLDLGGIFYAAGDYQNSAQLFNRAVNLKADFANAHYNLAQALKGLGENTLALQELQTTSTLVCVTANNKTDCERVNAEIEELNKTIANPEATPSAQIAPEVGSEQEPLATPGGQRSNLPAAAPTPAPQVSSESGELQP